MNGQKEGKCVFLFGEKKTRGKMGVRVGDGKGARMGEKMWGKPGSSVPVLSPPLCLLRLFRAPVP